MVGSPKGFERIENKAGPAHAVPSGGYDFRCPARQPGDGRKSRSNCDYSSSSAEARSSSSVVGAIAMRNTNQAQDHAPYRKVPTTTAPLETTAIIAVLLGGAIP
jgi:hypothetical protein